MSQDQRLRALVIQRLNAAAEEIFGLFERTVAEYEEELCRSKEENERQRELLNAVFKPQLRLHRSDMQPLSVSETGDLLEPQDWSPSLDQEDPLETPDIKQELWSGQEEEQLQELKGDDQQPWVSKEEVSPERQEGSPSPDQEDLLELPLIKEEQEELWTSREEERRRCLEEAEFISTPVPLKSEDDEESSQLHQNEQMDTEPVGQDCGSDPERQPDNEDCSDGMDGSKLKKGLNAPEASARRNPGDKLFSCSQCGKTFELRRNLKRHVRIHTGAKPFGCSACSRRFGLNSHLQRHLKSHTGEKPHSCSVCNKSFTRSCYLRVHARIHTGEKQFSCNVCFKRFTWPSQFKRHKCGGDP